MDLEIKKKITRNWFKILQDIICKEIEEIEKKNNIFKIKNYKKMMNKIDIKKKDLLRKIEKYKSQNFIICGIGAGAKANTFLTYYGIDNNMLKFITDNSIYKQNKLTPVSRILIKNDDALKGFKKIYCLILSWNISSLIKKKIKKINKNIKFLYI